MTERDRNPEERLDEDRIPGLERVHTDIGTGLGGGVAPVLPTDVDGHHPDTDWLRSSDQNAIVPNWTKTDDVEPGLADTDGTPPFVQLTRETHVLTVFGDDVGAIDSLYGYGPTEEPRWAAIRQGDRRIMVPIMSGQLDDEGLHVPYTKEVIESAPSLPDEGFSVAGEMELYSHYNERRILPASGNEAEERTLHPVAMAA